MTQPPRIPRRTLLAAAGAGAVLSPDWAPRRPPEQLCELTNLSHLDELTTTVRLRHRCALHLPAAPGAGRRAALGLRRRAGRW